VRGAIVVLALVSAVALAQTPAPAIEARHFSHKDHAARVDVGKCELCHSVDPKGQVRAPAAQGHAPCLDARCHASDFLAVGEKQRKGNPQQFAKTSAFCLGCYETVPCPWKKPIVKTLRSFENAREHHVEMNHYDHTVRAAKTTECRGCHVVDATSFALVVGTPGHGQCVACHNPKDYPEFTMSQCSSCHASQSRAEYLKAQQITSSRPKTDVRACAGEGHAQQQKKQSRAVPCFRHERIEHRTENGKPVQCVACHYIVGDKAKWNGRRYQTLADLQINPIIDNSRDRQHASCGASDACHKRDVDEVHGAKCNLCHAEKSAF